MEYFFEHSVRYLDLVQQGLVYLNDYDDDDVRFDDDLKQKSILYKKNNYAF